jgi:hypothetical protein
MMVFYNGLYGVSLAFFGFCCMLFSGEVLVVSGVAANSGVHLNIELRNSTGV